MFNFLLRDFSFQFFKQFILIGLSFINMFKLLFAMMLEYNIKLMNSKYFRGNITGIRNFL